VLLCQMGVPQGHLVVGMPEERPRASGKALEDENAELKRLLADALAGFIVGLKQTRFPDFGDHSTPSPSEPIVQR
jgi:hypothetical protein